MASHTVRAVVAALLISPVILVACAKRPVITGVGVAPPTGAAVSQAPAAPQTATTAPGIRADQVPAPTERGVTSPAAEGPRGTTTPPPVVGGPATPLPASPGAPAQSTSPSMTSPSSPQLAAPATAAPAPPAARPAPKEFTEFAELKDVYFDFDKSDIRPDAAKVLEASAAWLRTNDHLLLIEGHCDERGTNEYNLSLGERRARSTFNSLLALGVPANRMTIISYGEERPVCTEHAERCWSKNRRAHFLAKPR